MGSDSAFLLKQPRGGYYRLPGIAGSGIRPDFFPEAGVLLEGMTPDHDLQDSVGAVRANIVYQVLCPVNVKVHCDGY